MQFVYKLAYSYMQFPELACSYMSLHAVPFFVWAAHKNFAVLVSWEFDDLELLVFSFHHSIPTYRILLIPVRDTWQTWHVSHCRRQQVTRSQVMSRVQLVTCCDCSALIRPLSWLNSNPNSISDYQLEPHGGGTPEGRPGRMHFADGLYFIWWQTCEALVLKTWRMGWWQWCEDMKFFDLK